MSSKKKKAKTSNNVVQFLLDDEGESMTEEDLRELETKLEAALSKCKHLLATKDKGEALTKWKEQWKENLEVEYPSDKVKSFLEEVCKKIVIAPMQAWYEVAAKHGDSIQYSLIYYETIESNGKKQQVLLDKYTMNYADESQPWDFTSKEKIDRSISFAKHESHLDAYQIPATVPPQDECDDYLLYNGEERLGSAFRNDKGDLKKDLKAVLAKKKVWQIVAAMTNFDI